MLFLYKRKACPLCKGDKGKPTFTFQASNKSDLEKQTKARPKSPLEDEIALYVSSEAHSLVKELLSFKCNICNICEKNKPDLSTHYKLSHNKLVCNICLDNNHQFWDEIVPYDFDKLSMHKQGKLFEPGFTGHTYCQHCAKYFFNSESLKSHCYTDHQLCTVCEIIGRKLQFYNNFTALEQHYRSQHYCCRFIQCVKSHCFVFGRKAELWSHYNTEHAIDVQLADICIGQEPNPEVVSLCAPDEINRSTIHRETHNIVSPFAYSSSFEQLGNVPHFMNLRIIQQEENANLGRLNQVKCITKIFYNEINKGIKMYLDGEKRLEDLVKEIEDAVGNQVALRILSTVGFAHRQKEINRFVKEYKERVMFPPFKKNEKKTQEPNRSRPNIGFGIVDATKKGQRK